MQLVLLEIAIAEQVREIELKRLIEQKTEMTEAANRVAEYFVPAAAVFFIFPRTQ